MTIIQYVNFNQLFFKNHHPTPVFSFTTNLNLKFIFKDFFSSLDNSLNKNSDLQTISKFVSGIFYNLFLLENFFRKQMTAGQVTFFNSLNDSNLFRKSIENLNFKFQYSWSNGQNHCELISDNIESILFFIRKSFYLNDFHKTHLKLAVKITKYPKKGIVTLKLNHNFFFFFNYFSYQGENRKLLLFRNYIQLPLSTRRDLVFRIKTNSSLVLSIFNELKYSLTELFPTINQNEI